MEPLLRRFLAIAGRSRSSALAALAKNLDNGGIHLAEDPTWPDPWRDELRRQAEAIRSGKLFNPLAAGTPALLVATSGSTGLPALCLHSLTTIGAAAQAFAQRFPTFTHAISLLPPCHIGGILPAFRAAAAHGDFLFADYRQLNGIRAATFPLDNTALSLVPTQLSRILQSPDGPGLLRQFGLILLGGASCPPAILDQARHLELPLCLCYGSTETAAMVTALDPADFFAGHCSIGTPLPHASLSLQSDGTLQVSAPSVAHAIFPPPPGFAHPTWHSRDLASVDPAGRWSILGRADRLIISGGKKIHPETIEAAASAFPGVAAARCAALPDPDWGMRIELHLRCAANLATDDLRDYLRARLPAHAIPKAYHIEPAEPVAESLKWRSGLP